MLSIDFAEESPLSAIDGPILRAVLQVAPSSSPSLRCQANTAHMRQSRPDFGLDFQVEFAPLCHRGPHPPRSPPGSPPFYQLPVPLPSTGLCRACLPRRTKRVGHIMSRRSRPDLRLPSGPLPLLQLLARTRHIQGYLTHKKHTPLLGPPQGPRRSSTVGS